MVHEFTIKNCALKDFNEMFKNKVDYKKALREVNPTSERLFPPTSTFEANLQNSIISNKKIKLFTNQTIVTSYSVQNDQNKSVIYISYGGRLYLRSFMAGRKKDRGGFFEATQIGSDLRVKAKTRFEYHYIWGICFIILGFFAFFAAFILPGFIFLLLFFIGHNRLSKKLKNVIAPVLIQTFES